MGLWAISFILNVFFCLKNSLIENKIDMVEQNHDIFILLSSAVYKTLQAIIS